MTCVICCELIFLHPLSVVSCVVSQDEKEKVRIGKKRCRQEKGTTAAPLVQSHIKG